MVVANRRRHSSPGTSGVQAAAPYYTPIARRSPLPGQLSGAGTDRHLDRTKKEQSCVTLKSKSITEVELGFTGDDRYRHSSSV